MIIAGNKNMFIMSNYTVTIYIKTRLALCDKSFRLLNGQSNIHA